MGLLKGDIEKVPEGLAISEYYRRIFDWHKKNRDTILQRMESNNSSVRSYFQLVEKLPEPDVASNEDIALICFEVISGLMEWAYHAEDDHGVKTAAYAHYILDKFFDGFSGEETRALIEKSKLYRGQ